MALFDQETQTYNDASFGIDAHAATADEPSIFESSANVVTKGLPLTALAIANSFLNTGVDINNFFGGDLEKFKVEDEVDQEYADYYKAHESGIEAAGLLVGSFIPGTLAIKATKLLAFGKTSRLLAEATGIAPSLAQKTIAAGVAEIEAGSGALYGGLQADKYKAIALGIGDQALQGLVYETAMATTMHGSPLLEQDGLKETVENMFYGAVTGGVIGGSLEGVFIASKFNKALLNADVATKEQELATYLGGKNQFIAGDRVVALLDSIDAIPESSSVLGGKKAAATRESAILNSKKILTGIAPEGDPTVTTSFINTLLKMKDSGMDKEEMYGYLSRLAKVTRVTAPDDVQSGSIFYVNKFAKDAEPDWNTLVTSTPTTHISDFGPSKIEASLGFRLRDFATSPKIAKLTDTVEWEGNSVPAWGSAKDAFESGHDIFIGKSGEVFINPNAPNIERVARAGESRALTKAEEVSYRGTGKLPEGSKPLLGKSLTLDLRTGGVSESALATVGDHGVPELHRDGLRFGQELSYQDLANPIAADTLPLDANARYVWAEKRGIKNGDEIQVKDAAMLEQLYREASKDINGFDAHIAALEKRGVGIVDGDDFWLPTNQDQLLNAIRDAKDGILHDAIEKNPKLSSAEAAMMANVPEEYLANSQKATSLEQYMRPISDSSEIGHVKLQYDVGNIYQQDGQILKGLVDVQYRIQMIQDANNSAAARFFGEDWDKFKVAKSASDANIVGTGGKFLQSSNSNYGTLGQETERLGRESAQLITQRSANNANILAASVNDIRNDPSAAAELGMFISVRHKSPERWTFVPAQVAKSLDIHEDTVILADSLIKNRRGQITGWNKDYLPEGFTAVQDTGALSLAVPTGGLKNAYVLSPKVAAFERANLQINDARNVHINNFYAAQGLQRTMPSGTLYTPPIDTAKYPHFALVRAREGSGLADDSVSIITGRDAGDLEQKIASLSDDYSIYTKDMLKTHHEVLGDYEYNRNFSQSRVDNALSKRGILNDVYPTTRAESIIDDYVSWHQRAEMRLVRDHVEITNSQLFAELRAMGDKFTAAETSKTGFVNKLFGKGADNPYDSYVKQALAISPKEQYRLWADANEKAEAFFSTAFNTARKAFVSAEKGLLSYEDASALSQKFGLGNPYESATNAAHAYYDVANKLPPQKYLSKFVAMANSIQSATAIRLDAFQSLINVVSTPVLMNAEMRSVIDAETKKLSNNAASLLTTELPDGTGRMIPSITKVLGTNLSDWFNPAIRQETLTRYKDIGVIRDDVKKYFDMQEALTLPYGKFSESDFASKMKSAAELGAKVTGSNYAEQFVRWNAARAADKIFTAAGYSGQALEDNISTFVNRVHGNYIASQRPVAFQGPIGQAVGLFQTYQFNLMQQMFRYVENGEAKTLMTLAGMQTTLFGMQGLPGFQAINNHIIGNSASNPSHKDLYSEIPNFADKGLGDFLLYGSLSNVLHTGLYSRGDINPRQITILPVNPLDFPAIAGGVKLISSILDTSQKIAEGGKPVPSLLLGLEHNGISRPLSGLAQLAQGMVTTSGGSLVAVTNPLGDNSSGLSVLGSAANYARLAGARPLDEAIVMDAMYRKTLYQAKDTTRIADLGQAVKTTLYGNNNPDESELAKFSKEYAASGGQVENFGRKMIEWSKDANASVANKVYYSLKSPLNQNMMRIMGGEKLPDYTNTGSTSTAATNEP